MVVWFDALLFTLSTSVTVVEWHCQNTALSAFMSMCLSAPPNRCKHSWHARAHRQHNLPQIMCTEHYQLLWCLSQRCQYNCTWMGNVPSRLWDCQIVTVFVVMFSINLSLFFSAESWHRGAERARRAKRESSATGVWEETTTTHTEECCPHHKAHCSGCTSPVCQWNTCLLWPILPGVLSAGRVVSLSSKFLLTSTFAFSWCIMLHILVSANEPCFILVVDNYNGGEKELDSCCSNGALCGSLLSHFCYWIKHTFSLLLLPSSKKISHPPGVARPRYCSC